VARTKKDRSTPQAGESAPANRRGTGAKPRGRPFVPGQSGNPNGSSIFRRDPLVSLKSFRSSTRSPDIRAPENKLITVAPGASPLRQGMSTKGKSLDEIRADYWRVTAEIERRIAGGPPPGSGIALEAWRSWHRHGFVCCPASKLKHTCSDDPCRMGADCLKLRALGLAGDRSHCRKNNAQSAERKTGRASRAA
jgi:hypothetical protein